MASPRTRTNQYAQIDRFSLEKRLAAAREGSGLVLLGLSVFLSLALLSFHREDPSFNHVGGNITRNMAGKAGAYLADALFQFMGLAAFILPVLFLFLGWRMIRNRPADFYWDRWISLPVLIWTLCMLFFRLLPAALVAWMPAGAGGMVGSLGISMMHRHFGVWGTLALTLPLCFLSIMVLTHFSLARLLAGIGKMVSLFGAILPKHRDPMEPQVAVAKIVAPPPPVAAKPAPKAEPPPTPAPALVVTPAPLPAAPRAAMPETTPPPLDDLMVTLEEIPQARLSPSVPGKQLFQVVKKLLLAVWQLFFGESKSHRPKAMDRLEPEIDGQLDIPDEKELSLDGLDPWSLDIAKAPSPTTEESDPFQIPEVYLRQNPPPHKPEPLLELEGKASAAPPAPVVTPVLVITPEPDVYDGEEETEEEETEEEETAPSTQPGWTSGAELINPPETAEQEEEEEDAWSEEALALVKKPGDTPLPPPAPAIAIPESPPVAPVAKPVPITPPPLPSPEGNPLPPMTLLDPGDFELTQQDPVALQHHARLIEQKLADFAVKGNIEQVHPGPVVTTFELNPAPGLKAAKVVGLSDDLARSISANSVRVVGNIPGKSVIGIEVPNLKRQTVWLRRILESPAMVNHKSPLAVALGSDITGNPVVADLARMPHLLVAGTTGSGKSVAVNAMICSILFRNTPDQVQFLMVDPKMLELSIYEGIPHLLAPVVTEVKKASTLLKWAVSEMEDRYRLMSEMGVRNLAGFNTKIDECRANGTRITRRVKSGYDSDTGELLEREEAIPLEYKPLIVIVIDELADLMMQVGKDVEPAIARLAQMARAAGLHLILATQRPSVDVITGLIKANFPTRLAFQVSSRIDSRTILDAQGAEHLLGMGDGLYQPPGTSRMVRIHAPFVADHEVHNLVDYLKKTGRPKYNPAILSFRGEEEEGGGDEGEEDEYDELYDQAVALVIRSRKASTSMVQRQFKIGYNRAARIVERMAREGLVSDANSAGKREVLVPNREE